MRLVLVLCAAAMMSRSTVLVSGSTSSPNEDHHHDSDHHHYERHVVNNDNVHHTALYTQHHQHHQHVGTTSKVLELSDRFLDIVNTPIPPPPPPQGGSQLSPNSEPKYQPWLVKFYAPWCGHCKRLEPVFSLVAQSLHNTAIRVGRVDCTRFPSVGSEFKIHGYPTIMFISGPNKKHTFQGDRTLDQIVKFAKRMNAPATQTPSIPIQKFLESLAPSNTIPRTKRHDDASKTESSTPSPSPSDSPDLVFGLIRPNSLLTELVTAYKQVSSKYQQHNDFYEFFSQDSSAPVVFAFKGSRLILYNDNNLTNVTKSLETWVGNERFPDFMHLTRGNVHQVFHEGTSGYNAKHLIVTAVVHEDKLNRILTDNENRLLALVRSVTENAVQNTLTDHPDAFQVQVTYPITTLPLVHHYGWIGNPDLANSIVAEHLSLPTLLIIERSPSDHNHKYYVFSDWNQIDSESKIENIIELVKEGHFTPTVYANSWSFRVYRYVFDAKVSLTDMWVGNPVLTIVLFGLPLGFLSLILYSVCCGDLLDAKEPDDELPLPDDSEDDEQHEKRE